MEPAKPYIADLDIEVQRALFAPGTSVTLEMHGQRLDFVVIKAFLPFTKSVALLAQCPKFSIAVPVIIKIFDTRFLDHRGDPSYNRPWSLEAEQAAVTLGQDFYDSFEPTQLEQLKPEENDAAGQLHLNALWDIQFRRMHDAGLANECKTYERLLDVQGISVPRFYGVGSYIPPDQRTVRPPTLVLEYIEDSVIYHEIKPGGLHPSVCFALARTLDSFKVRGMLNCDANPDNLLFTPSNNPERGVMIDFGWMDFKPDDTEGDEWQSVWSRGKSERVKELLAEKCSGSFR